ncbi:MAG: multicopper oxidase domain-containing protein [Armatimonadetes bacterium]|nr:multicopper oxidase domain-containing protein [Armatimonadota bacterium]
MKRQDRPFQKLWVPERLSGKTFNLMLSKTKKSFWEGATTTTYGYNGAPFWGPTLVFQQGERVTLNVTNALDEPTTCHWHGLHLPAAMDGGPHQLIAPGKTWQASFEVKNHAATYWYHPHAHESTQKQLTYGAGGLIIIKDPLEAALALPRTYGVDDIPLVFTSRRFYENNQFSFEGDRDKYGDFLFANGVLDAEIRLPAQLVRLRILNAEIERGYDLGLSDNRIFHLIATDGGLVEKPVPLKRLKLMPGERVELLVDLSRDAYGSSLDLMSFNAGQAFGFPGAESQQPRRPNGGLLNAIDFRLLRITVGLTTPVAVTQLPSTLVKNPNFTPADVQSRRTVRINGQPGGNPEFYFDQGAYDMHQTNHVVKLGAVEAWTVVNNRVFGHSFHIHDVQFRIVERSNGPIPAHENGWKDTFYIPRNESVTFVAKFEDFASPTDPYMYHCHMSNHEDGGLMGQFVVVKDPTAFQQTQEKAVTPEMLLAAEKQTGKRVTLETHNKPLVLHFIEQSCPCSRDSAPFLDRLAAQLGDSCQIIGVINATSPQAKAWAKQTGIKLPLLADPDRKLITAYGAERSVYTTLVAPDGRIVKTYPGYSQAMLLELAQKLSQLTGKRLAPLSVSAAPKVLTSGCTFPKA